MSTILAATKADRTLGTVISFKERGEDVPHWHADLEAVVLGTADDSNAAKGRLLEIFLDQIAWRAARAEASWLLDSRYRSLLRPEDEDLVEHLRDLEIPDSDDGRWEALRDVLRAYGSPQTGTGKPRA